MINLAVRSEYSFKETFGHLDTILANHTNGEGVIGIADKNNTFAHSYLEQKAKELNLKPIFGVRLEVVPGATTRTRGLSGPWYLFIAKNEDGLHEINSLVKRAWEQFYYKPQLDKEDLNGISNNVFVISDNPFDDCNIDYLAVMGSTPLKHLKDKRLKKVFIQDNHYCTYADKGTYELFCGARKMGHGYNYLFDTKTFPQHILSEQEFRRILNDDSCVENSRVIAEQCEVTLQRADMVKYPGVMTIERACLIGAVKRKIPLDEEPYASRYEREMGLIKEKNYGDYFLIVADIVAEAKRTMFVGAGRGSSASSLVCYLMGITDVEPIKHDLVFERFIDVTRADLPDIDIDFPDTHRQKVVRDIIKKYGRDNVCFISNVNKIKAKSAINDFGIALRIPSYELEALKDSIVDRSGGDARAAVTLADTLETSVGKEFVERYPSMALTTKITNHAAHAGKHAAGVIVCNDDIAKYGGVNAREGSVMLDKNQAEYLNLLKIDCLGLRTLSILQDVADQIDMPYSDFHKLPLDDEKTFKVFNDMRLSGIFQFEGQTMYSLCQAMGVESFDDVVALTAIARPGPLHSGGAGQYIKRRTGEEKVTYASDNKTYVKVTKPTYGVIVFQEQLMQIAKECGNMTWEEVSAIRKAASKTLGKEFFDQYRESFLRGTEENGFIEEEAVAIWESMITFGSWAIVKAHAVSYSYISYHCAWAKAHHPLEFYAATLRNSKGTDQTIAVLRDALENEGIEYTSVDPDESEINWSVSNGRLLGGLSGIKGIGDKKAKDVLNCRLGKKKYTPSLIKALMNPVTEYETLYPCRDLWEDKIYKGYKLIGLSKKPSLIKNLPEEGTVVIVGQVKMKDLRDLNEYNELMKRNGEVYHTDNMFLKLYIEDDTGRIQCRIGRFDFDRLGGQHLSDTLKEDKSWCVVKGRISAGWNIIFVDSIYDLSRDERGVFSEVD